MNWQLWVVVGFFAWAGLGLSIQKSSTKHTTASTVLIGAMIVLTIWGGMS